MIPTEFKDMHILGLAIWLPIKNIKSDPHL